MNAALTTRSQFRNIHMSVGARDNSTSGFEGNNQVGIDVCTNISSINALSIYNKMAKHPRIADLSPAAKVFPKRSRLIRHTFHMYPEIPVDALNEVIGQIKPDVTVLVLESIPTSYLSRQFQIILSDDSILHLCIPPIFGIRLLREERKLIQAQTAVSTFLRDIEQLNIAHPTNSTIQPYGSSSCKYASRISGLLQFIPEILKYSMEEKDLTLPYIISEFPRGTPLSDLSLYLTIPEQKSTYRQLGSLYRTLSLITSPTKSFGPVANVLSSLIPKPTSRPSSSSSIDLNLSSITISEGCPSWSNAFAVLMESAMRDAEDMLVNIPYHELRRYMRDYSHYFDDVLVPRLVVLNMLEVDNVLVDRDEKGATVVGLRDWSKGIFGDVSLGFVWAGLCGGGDLSRVERGEEREAFCDGWRDILLDGDADGYDKKAEEINGDCHVNEMRDSEVSRKFRELMYVCYHSVVTIATEYQRPRTDSIMRDDAGRLRLMSAINQLKAMESHFD